MPNPSLDEIRQRIEEARALIDKGEFKKAKGDLLKLLDDIPDHDEFLEPSAEADLLLAEVITYLADFDRAKEIAARTIETAKDMKDDRLLARAYCQHGHILLRTSEFDLAKRHLEKGLELARRSKDQAVEGLIIVELANLTFFKGDPDKAEANLRDGVLLLEKVGDMASVARAFNNLATFIFHKGDKERALEIFDRGKEKSRKAGARRYLALAMMNKAGILIELERPEEALKEAGEAARAFDELGDKFLEARSYVAIGLALALLKRWPEAEENLHKARIMLKMIGMPVTKGIVLLEMGRVYLLKGDRKSGLRYIDEAKAIFTEHGHKTGLKTAEEYLKEYLEGHQATEK